MMCPEGAAKYAAYQQALRDGRIHADESAVLFNCASGMKYDLPPMEQMIDLTKPIELRAFSS